MRLAGKSPLGGPDRARRETTSVDTPKRRTTGSESKKVMRR
jgi:hypothetical protein